MLVFLIFVISAKLVDGYVSEEHFSEIGLVVPVRDNCTRACYCFFSIVDNLHALTVASCFYLYSELKAGNKEHILKELLLVPLNKKGDYSQVYKVSDFLLYEYTKGLVKYDEFYKNYLVEDFGMFVFERKLPFNEKHIVTRWPSDFVDRGTDLENVLEQYENEKKIAYVWAHWGWDLSFHSGVVSGHMLTRSECIKIQNCTNNVELNEESKERHCFLLNHNFNTHCILHDVERFHCREGSVGAPVIIDGRIWGVARICDNDITIYYGLERSFKFVYTFTAGKSLLGESDQTLTIVMSILAVLFFAVISVVCFCLFKKSNRKRRTFSTQSRASENTLGTSTGTSPASAVTSQNLHPGTRPTSNTSTINEK